MSQHDDRLPLHEMLEHAREALEMIQGRERAVATRNFIAHGYDRIDYDVVWDTVAADFPPLVAALERALSEPG